ncbi:amidohydrolase family protein [Acanthopleuribacter pedis]|uniref:Amidohydrolase family protein n=1 Tax=Acanthopleuribacter pedis TaxID=442870 RepID=A0A8J7U4P9_9BACT|nr:amidohydrolase family protein [Acanthopleuribacter pedis]MBO1317225.1 amidohydrolase family protein [Acanthopleuribacter pedis]MBO1318531.1 amidohydrolase family protein [Acanthopleuribacter pedis]
MKKSFIGYWLLFAAALASAQTRHHARQPVGLQENPPTAYAVTGVTVQADPKTVIENAVILVRDGVIEAVGPAATITLPADALVIDKKGAFVYPGFIDLMTDAGKKKKAGEGGKKNQPAGTADHNAENTAGKLRADSYNYPKKKAKTLREAGFTAAVFVPSGGIFRGIACLTLLQEGRTNDVMLDPEVAGVVSFEGAVRQAYPDSAMGGIAMIRQTVGDARWYEQAHATYQKHPTGQTPPSVNRDLAALVPFAKGEKPFLFQVRNHHEALRALKLSEELKVTSWVFAGDDAYRRVDAFKAYNPNLILPLDFAEKPAVADPAMEGTISLRELRHWYLSPAGPAALAEADINFVLTSHGLKKSGDILGNLRLAHHRGLAKETLLAALTTRPAAWLNQSDRMGVIKAGAMANFFITAGDLFTTETTVGESWVRGERRRFDKGDEQGVLGDYQFTVAKKKYSLTLAGSPKKLKGTLKRGKKDVTTSAWSLDKGRLVFHINDSTLAGEGVARVNARVEENGFYGQVIRADGTRFSLNAQRGKAADADKPKAYQGPKLLDEPLATVFPDGAFGRNAMPEQPALVAVTNATIWTSGPDGNLENATLLVKAGKIAAVGTDVAVPEGALVIDAAGKHVSPGLIDEHSHAGLDAVNEWTTTNSAEVGTHEVINPDDISLYYMMAGGLTMANQLHGSANPIGGQNSVIKLRWGKTAEELRYANAMPGIKFALGENVKRANFPAPDGYYPLTRLGVEQFFRDQFDAALAYRAAWQDYEKAADKKHRIPPRRDYRWDTLLEIIDGKRQIHCHSYRQDEILALMRVAEDFGFKIDVFTHILEGYKVAPEMAKHGAMANTFTDWWAFKMEVVDAMPYNAALMHQAGVVVGFNSDDDELARRLNTEAAKAVKYGGVSPEEALKMVTLNPARQLRIDEHVGSLEVGKDADFVLWNHSPLSMYAVAQQTWIDGTKYFDREEAKQHTAEAQKQRRVLIQLALSDKGKGPKSDRAKGKTRRMMHCEDLDAFSDGSLDGHHHHAHH